MSTPSDRITRPDLPTAPQPETGPPRVDPAPPPAHAVAPGAGAGRADPGVDPRLADPSPPPRTRAILSREAIVAAAVALVDEGGPDALTMRAVADRLGSGVMSLYRHVPDREALLDLALDAMAAEITLAPPTGDWRADAASVARAVRAALLRRPNLTVLLTSRADRHGAGLQGLDQVLGVFRAAGFAARDAVLANHALGNYVAGVALWEAEGLAGTTGEDRRARKEAAAAGLRAVPPDAFPNVAWAVDELFAGTLDDRFEFGLAALLDGLERRLAGRDRGAVSTEPSVVERTQRST